MPTFQTNKYRAATGAASQQIGQRYRSVLARYPFLTFGLPFLIVIVGGSFVLTPATAVRYERHDRKVRQMTREEELGIRKGVGARRVDMREEYNRLAGRELNDWEQRRVKRLPGEHDGLL